MIPLAHLGHWLWIFYVIPVLIVIARLIQGFSAGGTWGSANPTGSTTSRRRRRLDRRS